ncbi:MULTISPECIES: hypothetical protein [Bacillus]|uniref:hypothetical protein n=1 Tax=Bacillus TaxID=1386 RepID=UPI000BFBD55B|nr:MULTISPECIES: hypothetical protein [Bacillus]PGK19258.1 hypothetical protein CN903_24795 [Bacillus cereus]PGU92194.1 hypothetical protein COD77_29385 [Bacillus cereus]
MKKILETYVEIFTWRNDIEKFILSVQERYTQKTGVSFEPQINTVVINTSETEQEIRFVCMLVVGYK